MRVWRRIRAVLFRPAAERDLDDEIGLHLALEAEQLEQQGLDTRTAATTAKRRFGRVDAIKDALRTVRGVEPIEDFRRDLAFAARALRRRLGFATVVVLTLVIGLTSATTMFGVVYGVLWAPLPYGDADRIVTLWQTNGGSERGRASLPNFLDWRERSHSFATLAAAEPFGVRYMTVEGPERLPAWRVTQGFFDVLHVAPLLGRTFAPDEYQRGRDAVVVLDYDTWRDRFNGDSSLVGKTLTINDAPTLVVGVMPRGVSLPSRGAIWVPKIPEPDELLLRSASYFNIVGRLAPGVTIERAREEMTRIAAALAQEYPADRDVGVAVGSLRETLVGGVRGRLLVLFISVGLLLLLTAANLTTLLLARAVEREGEMSIRAALGAGRARLARQIFAEHALLALIGCGLSLALTFLALRGVRALGQGLLPLADEIHIGVPVALFAAITALASVMAPAAPGRRRGRRFQQALVVTEVALALVLVCGAGLFVRSVRALLGVDPGFSSSNVLAVTLQTEFLFPTDSLRATFVRTLSDRLATIPGVKAAGVTTALPFGGTIGPEQASFEVRGRPVGETKSWPTTRTAGISPGYFAALHVPLRDGRSFIATDDASHPRVAIVSAAFARRFGTAIGDRLDVAYVGDPIVYEIVGVASDVHDAGLEQPPLPILYIPYAQVPTGGVTFVLETATAPRAMLSRVRRELAAVNASQPIASVASLDELLGASTRGPRLVLTILGLFASIALTLAGVGIFGVMSHLTRTRTREVGIRLALGATARSIRGLILGEAIALAGIGSGIGLIVALISGRSIRALLYAVSPVDPVALGAGIAILLTVASVAAYIPAQRAGSVDAVRALREN
jgi:putative ABC transport system permease protein